MIDKRPTVTAIIPTIGRSPDILAGCVFSVVNQTFAPTRVLVVDASPTPLRDVEPFNWLCNLFGVEIHRTPQNSTQMYNRVYGARQSTSSLLWFVDDDLFLHRECLARLVNTFYGQTPQPPFVGGVKHEVVKKVYPWGANDFLKAINGGDTIRETTFTDGGNVLLYTRDFLKVQHVTPNEDPRMGAEDFVYLCQVADSYNRLGVVNSGAMGYHLRVAHPVWTKHEKTAEFVVDTLKAVGVSDQFIQLVLRETQREDDVGYRVTGVNKYKLSPQEVDDLE